MKTENYITNSLKALKGEALTRQDIPTLRMIKDYDHRHEIEQRYFVRELETSIYDAQGNEIDPASLPFSQDELSMHFYGITTAITYKRMPDRDGDLMRDIEFTVKQSSEWSAMILEVPANTIFPVPGTFGWWLTTCNAYYDSGEYILPDSATRSRLHYRLDRKAKQITAAE